MTLFETAISLNAQYHINYFSTPEHARYLERLDILYVFEKKLLLQKENIEWTIDYIKQKLQSVEYLSQPMFPGTHLELGNLYIRQGNSEQAMNHW